MSKRPDNGTLRPTRRAFIVGSSLAAAGAAAYAVTPRRSENRLAKAKLADLIPATIGDWRFITKAGVIVTAADGPVDGYDQVLTRVYEGEGLPSVMLLMAYGSTQGGSLQLHRPETCYPGQGFKLSNFHPLDLDIGAPQPIHARTFTATRDERIEHLFYWTRISNTFPRNTAEEYGAILRSVLSGFVPDGILVRGSIIAPDAQNSVVALERFALALIEATKVQARTILIGSAMTSALAQTGEVRKR